MPDKLVTINDPLVPACTYKASDIFTPEFLETLYGAAGQYDCVYTGSTIFSRLKRSNGVDSIMDVCFALDSYTEDGFEIPNPKSIIYTIENLVEEINED